MGEKPLRTTTRAKSAAAKKTRPTQAPTPQPNFHLVGEPYGTPTTIANLLRYARVEPRGRNRWYVETRPLEWVLVPGHIVWLTPSGLLACDCRQSLAGRGCEHVLAVRQLGTLKPSRAADARQMEIDVNVPPTVRIATPPGRRYRGEYHVVESYRHRNQAASTSERTDG